MVSDKSHIISIIKNNRQQLLAFGASRIGIFGSYKRGQNKEGSDVDIYIEFEKGKKNFRNYTGAYFLLKELLQKDIDFVTAESLSPYIGPHILKEVDYVALRD